jgi:phosphotransferase system enzyme I (PtsI)
MSFTLHGLGVSPGIAIGTSHLVSHATLEVSHYVIPAKHIDEELSRFDAAIGAVREELRSIKYAAGLGAPSEIRALIDVHAMILADPTIASVPRQMVRERRCNAEWALVQQMEQLVEQFEEIEDPYLRERKADVVQVVERLLKAMSGRSGQSVPRRKHEDGVVVVAHDLSPADTIHFRQQQITSATWCATRRWSSSTAPAVW